jgi:hypothetical protein
MRKRVGTDPICRGRRDTKRHLMAREVVAKAIKLRGALVTIL